MSSAGRNGRAYRRRVAEVKAARVPCALCGVAIADTIDHVIPLSKGGTCTPDNERPACLACNAARGARPVRVLVLAHSRRW